MLTRNKGAIRSNIMLIITALIWGSAFVAQYIGSSTLEPFSFNSVRMLIGGIVLLPVILLSDKLGISHPPQSAKDKRDLLLGGVLCGVVLCAASNLQQFGIGETTAGKAGFITAMYIVLVPLISLFLGQKSGLTLWISVAVAAVGLYLLCVKENFTVNHGDFLIMLCAVCYAFHILLISHFSSRVDGVRMSCIQFWVAGIVGLPGMFLFETPTFAAIFDCRWALLYAGVLSCGVGYTLQILAQRDADPTVASLLMSLESVFSVLSGWIVLGDVLSPKEAIGCVLIFAAVILAQLPPSFWHRFSCFKKEKKS